MPVIEFHESNLANGTLQWPNYGGIVMCVDGRRIKIEYRRRGPKIRPVWCAVAVASTACHKYCEGVKKTR